MKINKVTYLCMWSGSDMFTFFSFVSVFFKNKLAFPCLANVFYWQRMFSVFLVKTAGGRQEIKGEGYIRGAPQRIRKWKEKAVASNEYLMEYTLMGEVFAILKNNNSEKMYKKVFYGIASEYGKCIPNMTWTNVQGSTEMDACRIVVEDVGLPMTKEEFFKEMKAKVSELLPQCQFMPGAEELIKHLYKNHIPIAVATSSSEDSVKLKTSNLHAFKLMHHIVCASTDPDVKAGKPAPDVFLVCASKFPGKPKPEKCLVFEDAFKGVLAAKAAGMQVVLVPDSQLDEEKKQEATLVYRSLKDVDLTLFGLPELTCASKCCNESNCDKK